MKKPEDRYWDLAWSLVEGCSHVSEGCKNCWLEAMNKRFSDNKWGKATFRTDRLDIPLRRKKPTVYSVWSDLFHEDITADQIINAFEVMTECPQHTFIVCTKRPERMAKVLYGSEGNWYLGGGDYLPNVILMTTAENQEMVDKRIPELLKCRPFRLAVSVEPMLEPIDLPELNPSNLCLVVCGAETGAKARPMEPWWALDLKDQCSEAGIPFFFKRFSALRPLPTLTEPMPREFPVYEDPTAMAAQHEKPGWTN